jgi:hypothetical protein
MKVLDRNELIQNIDIVNVSDEKLAIINDLVNRDIKTDFDKSENKFNVKDVDWLTAQEA